MAWLRHQLKRIAYRVPPFSTLLRQRNAALAEIARLHQFVSTTQQQIETARKLIVDGDRLKQKVDMACEQRDHTRVEQDLVITQRNNLMQEHARMALERDDAIREAKRLSAAVELLQAELASLRRSTRQKKVEG